MLAINKQRLLPLILVLLVAGFLCLSAPLASQAEDIVAIPVLTDTTDTILLEDEQNLNTVTNAVYSDVIVPLTKTQTTEAIVLVVTGDGVETPMEYTLSELQEMDQYRQLYSTINTYPTKSWYVGEGVKVRDLLQASGIKDEATLIKFTGSDGFSATFTVQELINEDRYLFPNFREGHEYYGYIPGSPEGAKKVEPSLALMSSDGDNFDWMTSKESLHLIFGQRALTEQTNAVFAKKVNKVEVFTTEPDKWAAPTADVPSGEVTAGTLVKLSGPNNDTDKVHYTLDGSNPTVESPMYNWIAQRWSNRSDFDEINHPIEITKDTTIKAIVIGPGKLNSDIVTFEYQVPKQAVTFTVTPADATVVVTDSEGQEVVAEIDGTYNLPAGEYDYIVSKDGYVTQNGTIIVESEVKTIEVTLEEEVEEDPTIDFLYDGEVALTSGETFTVTAYNSGTDYTVSKNTPLGALHAASIAVGFTYDVTDKNYESSGALLLDNVGDYNRKPGYWYAYVNDAYKDGYKNPAGALNLIELVDGDRVEFYYAADITDATDLNAVKAAATAAVKTVVDTEATIPTNWTLLLSGAKDETVTKTYFEAGLACSSSGHQVFWTDEDGNEWGGTPLWLLVAMVDDNPDMGSDHINFNDELAAQNYEVNVIAGDGFKATFNSADIARNNDYIVANTLNGEPLPLKTESGKGCWPLYLKGEKVSGKQQVGNIVRIELSGLPETPDQPIPEVRIVKYAEDGITILEEMTVDYHWLEENLEVIGDGTTVYKFEGITNNPDDVWDADETYPGGFKVANAVKGTRIKDLCEQVGGMGAGTEIVLVANDGWETRLPYSSIYTDPSVQERQGDAILAWWGDGNYVPDYIDGMRLFFTPDDHVYSQWDMHETLPENYWHYYYGGGVQYPSCAGLAAKYITEIKLYSIPQGDWTLELDGKNIGGLDYDVSKTYFEQALTCTFGANHKATYTDSKGRIWEGMPLWFLVGFIDDADQHSNNAFNDELAMSGYQVVITAIDGHSVTIDSVDIIRNSDYIIANSLNGAPIPESDGDWPLRLVGPAVTGLTSISQIVSIELVSTTNSSYKTEPVLDDAYTIGTTTDGISTMTVNNGISGFKYFAVDIEPITPHSGNETVVFTHLRNGNQLTINATTADYDLVEIDTAQAGFNIQPGDVIKAYIVDQLTNSTDQNPVILQ